MIVNITEAGSPIGLQVVRRLLEMGVAAHDIALSVRSAESVGELAGSGCQVREVIENDRESLERSFRGCDVVLLIPSLAMIEVRVQEHHEALAAARAAGVSRVVFSGFMATSLDSPYIIAPYYAYAELKLRQSGLGWTILRDGICSEPLVSCVPEFVQLGRVPFPAGRGRAAYISREDLARATAAACLNSAHIGELYELTGPEALSINQVAAILSRVTGVEIPYQPAGIDEFIEICAEHSYPRCVVDSLVSVYQSVDKGEFAKVTDHVERLTGHPAEALEPFLRRTLAPPAS